MVQTFPILLDNKNRIEITLWPESHGDDVLIKIDATTSLENGEAEIQIKEGNSYEYKLTDGYKLGNSDLVIPLRSNANSGRIVPNIYVGTLSVDIISSSDNLPCGKLRLEVRSVKTEYREDYRTMLEDITEKSTDLILLHSSPVTQNLLPDFSKDPETLYQRFAFIKSVLDSVEFNDAVHKVISAPVTKWVSNEVEKDIRNIKRFDSKALRQISNSSNRIHLPEEHPLYKRGLLRSVPQKIIGLNKKESIDTLENRFVKYALESFLDLVGKIRSVKNINLRLYRESSALEDKIEQLLSHSAFKEISQLTSVPLNSPVLQRKEGYREILRAWIMFDLAARLIWQGGEDVYEAGKRDVATLYEYWLFFKLLDTIKEVFKVDPKTLDQLIKPTNDNLGLQLKQGKHIAIKGVFEHETRRLNIEFSFNRSFSGKKEYPLGGSWTKSMRPDYTLSIWPEALTQDEAEKEESIVHIHFDAKYKVEHLSEILDDEEEDIEKFLDEEKEENSKGNFKRIDLLKMHAYKDAIRRTGGAYVLYPGKNRNRYTKKGFHEILPGLGAFAIRPDKSDDGSFELKNFIHDVVKHFLNRTSQREKAAFRTYDIHKDDPGCEVNEPIPEPYGENRGLIPDETFILVAYYRNKEQLDWIAKKNLYNARIGTDRGSLTLSPQKTGAAYILLHGSDETVTGRLMKLNEGGPRIFSKEDMIKNEYPNPSKDFYLVYTIKSESEKEFTSMKWDVKELKGYNDAKNSTFSVSLSELMKVLVK